MALSNPDGRAPTWASLELAGGDVVIYDSESHTAWLQSDAPVDLDEMR